MAKSRFVSYLRVSTARQGTSGLGLEAQRAAVAGFLNGGDWTLVEEVLEVESGKRNDRPALATALKLCRKHRATLVIAKLDRLARNVAFISNLMEASVEFVAVDMPQGESIRGPHPGRSCLAEGGGHFKENQGRPRRRKSAGNETWRPASLC